MRNVVVVVVAAVILLQHCTQCDFGIRIRGAELGSRIFPVFIIFANIIDFELRTFAIWHLEIWIFKLQAVSFAHPVPWPTYFAYALLFTPLYPLYSAFKQILPQLLVTPSNTLCTIQFSISLHLPRELTLTGSVSNSGFDFQLSVAFCFDAALLSTLVCFEGVKSFQVMATIRHGHIPNRALPFLQRRKKITLLLAFWEDNW